MTIIDDTTVAVETFLELRTILQGNNAYELIYLAADIMTAAGGISIPASKSQVTIDGLYPADGTGTVHTLTEYNSTSASDTIGIRSSSSITMTVRNLKIIGQNYYGILYVPEGAAYENVTVIYENITYVGPQITYHPNGITRYLECDITIAPAYSAANEVGEVYRVEIGGNTSIRHTGSGNAVFWFRGSMSSPSFTILPGASVEITTASYMLYTTYAVDFTVSSGASLRIVSQTGICNSASHLIGNLLVDTDAVFHVTRASGSYATIYCSKMLRVNAGAEVYMQSDYTSAPPQIYFYASGTRCVIQNPKRFVLYNRNTGVFNFSSTTEMSITAGQLNYWAAATALETAGGFTDIPLYSWRKANHTPVSLILSATSGATVIASHNLTSEELESLPALSGLNFRTAQVLSMGNLPLQVSAVTNDGYPIEGTTAPFAQVKAAYAERETAGKADDAGEFSLATETRLSDGQEVVVQANLPFLLVSVTVIVVADGNLKLLWAPDTITFHFEAVSGMPRLYGRAEAGQSVIISDTRARKTAWSLFASIAEPLTSSANPAHRLPGSLVYVSAEQEQLELGEMPIVVYSNDGGEETIEVSWPEDQGPLLRPSEFPFYNGESYKTTIAWSLRASEIK